MSPEGGGGGGEGGAREGLRDRLAYLQYRSAEWVATSLPEPVGRRLFRLAAHLQHRFDRGARRVVEANLARVLGLPPGSPVLAAAVREAFDSYVRYWFDTFLLRVLPAEELRKRFEMRGLETVDEALEEGRGAVLCLPHLGNWDAAGRWMTVSGYRITAVAEALRPESVFRLFLEHRRALGLSIIPLSDTRKVAEDLVALLRRNELVALVADRDLRNTGVDVEMFGATRKLPAGPALLSLTAGSPLISAAVYDTEDGWRCQVGRRLEVERTDSLREDVTSLTRLMAAEFERAIAAAPTQWHMWRPAWPDEARP